MRFRTLLLPSLAVIISGSCQTTDEAQAPSSTAPSANAPEVRAASTTMPVAEAIPAAAPATERQDEALQGAVDRVTRIRERQAYLASEYLRRGDELLERADLQGALTEYSNALEIMPSNEDARLRLRKVEGLMGNRYANAADYLTDAVEQETVRRAQARISAEQRVTDGDNHMRLQDYDSAVESYRRALTILRYNPLIATESLDEKIADGKLSTAVSMAAAAESAADQARINAANTEKVERESERREYRANQLRTLYAQANNRFQNEQYSQAQTLAEQILLLDPGNRAATEMRDIAKAARHQKVTEENRRQYRENWVRTFEELESLGVIQNDIIEFDLRRWREVAKRQPNEFQETDPLASAGKDAILARLDELTIRPKFGDDGEGAPLTEIASYLQQVTGVNFLVSQKVTDELDEDETSVNLDLPQRSVKKTLDIITEVRENLAWKIEDGIVKFVTIEELTGGQVLRMYEVRDLIRPIKDFPAREINLSPSGGPPDFDEELEEREALVITDDTLSSLIQDNISQESWDADGASLQVSNGTMVVKQTPEVHALIKSLLDDLREATGIMVAIESRFLTVEDNFLEDIGIDFRGLGAPGLGTNSFFNDFGDPTTQAELGSEVGSDTDLGAFYDDGGDGDVRARVENLYDSFLGDEDLLTGAGGLSFQWTYLNDLQIEMVLRAVSKSERVELVTAPRVLVFNTARSNLTVMNQVAYVQDYDVEIATAASIADPIISVVEDGVILDVRPVVSADRRFLTLELRPTVATLKRPIETFETSLGSSGATVSIQLPEIEISRVRTSVPMPDGGTVLLGGFKIHQQQDLRSGVPILNKIPIISFFFERKGQFVSNRKLLILLTANIVIPEEHEPTAAQLGHWEGLSSN